MSSRRSSKQFDTSSEFYLECKAAFLSIYDDLSDKVESKKRLNSVLQQSGRNPSRAALDKYWTKDTEELSFTDYVEICRKEPVTTADDLMKAFRKIDINGDGYISLDELYKIMNAQDEQMTREEVRLMIDEVDENKDGRLDYSEFTNMIMKTTEESKKFSMKVMEKKEKKKRRGEKLRSAATNQDSRVAIPDSDNPDIFTTENKAERKQEENEPEATDTAAVLSKIGQIATTNKSPSSSVEDWVNSLPEFTDEAEGTEGREGENEFGTETSIKVKNPMGSKTSLKSAKEFGSQVSVKSKKAEAKEGSPQKSPKEKMGLQISLKSGKDKMGSQVSTRSVREKASSETVAKDKMGSQTSIRSAKEKMGSQTSLRSVKEKMDSSSKHARESKGEQSNVEDKTPETVQESSPEQTGAEATKKESPKASPRSRTNSASKPKDEKPTPREKATPRRESLGKSDKPPLPDSPKKHDLSTEKTTLRSDRSDTHKTGSKDSARTVGEEIEYDDDCDIVSTGRPTPRVDLKTPKSEDKPKDDKQEEKPKGKKADKTEEIDSGAPDSMAEESKKTDKESHLKEADNRSATKEDSSKEEKVESSRTVEHELTDTVRSTTSSFVDDIFRSSRNRRSLLAHEFELLSTDTDTKTAEKQESPKPPPRKSSKDVKKLEGSVSSKLNEHGLGSQLSLRSDDVPRPSPRVTKSKLRSPSSRTKDAMPDARALRDWHHSTSKGCFFYEEDEIVSHVYSLRLQEDSTVYLSAYPIQEPGSLNLPGSEPVDTALFVLDSRGKVVTCTEDRDTKGVYGVKCELSAGEYEILPYTTGCRFRQRSEDTEKNIKEAKLVKTKDDKVVITTAFRRALEDIFDLCDLDNNGTMSRDEFNWFNLRTSGEELGDDEWEVVEEKTALENGEITKKGFIELNEMEAEDAAGDVEDLWITLTSMGMNKGLIMDETCPFRVDVYVETARKSPRLKVTGIESLEKREYVSEICQYTIQKADEPLKIRGMKDLYKFTYKNEQRATIIIDNRSRSSVSLEVDCSKSKNVTSNRPSLNYTLDVNPQDMAIAHHLLPKSELSEWTVSSSENILK